LKLSGLIMKIKTIHIPSYSLIKNHCTQ
jgi:hypothetical protein